MEPDLAAAVVVVTLLALTRNIAAQIFLSLPATVLHELAHWVVALLTGSSPSLPSVWPRRVANGWQLGQVSFEAKTFSAGWVALAPGWVLGAVCWFILTQHTASSPAHEFALGLLAGYCAWGMLPSPQDWTIALRYPLGSVSCLTLVSLWLALYVL